MAGIVKLTTQSRAEPRSKIEGNGPRMATSEANAAASSTSLSEYPIIVNHFDPQRNPVEPQKTVRPLDYVSIGHVSLLALDEVAIPAFRCIHSCLPSRSSVC